jgi:hypothetical protein
VGKVKGRWGEREKWRNDEMNAWRDGSSKLIPVTIFKTF